MSELTSTWLKIFEHLQEFRKASNQFYERLLAELYAAEAENAKLAQSILVLIERMRAEDVVDVSHSYSKSVDRQSALIDDIEQLCRDQVKEESR